jgi:hypothetical protein
MLDAEKGYMLAPMTRDVRLVMGATFASLDALYTHAIGQG